MLTAISVLIHQQADYESLIFTKVRVVSMDKREAVEGEGRTKAVAGTDTDLRGEALQDQFCVSRTVPT